MAGGKGNTTSNNILKLIFNATNWANIADNTATSPNTNLFVALHTTSPAASGNQTTNEAAYTSYGRVTVARTTSGWTAASAQSTSPVAAISFTTATGGSETETYFSVGMLTSGAGIILYFGTVTPNITVNSGVTPQLTTGSTISEA
jgi:hypothetical protein